MKVRTNTYLKLIIVGFVLTGLLVLHFIPVSSHQDPCGYGVDYRIILGQLNSYEETNNIAHNGISLEKKFQYGSQCGAEGNNRPNKLFVL